VKDAGDLAPDFAATIKRLKAPEGARVQARDFAVTLAVNQV